MCAVIPVADLTRAEISRRCVDAQRELALSSGPVFRLVHLTLPGTEGRLFVVVHHLLLDGWSMTLLVDDVETALVSASTAGRPQLPPRTASVGQLADAYDSYVASGVARTHAAAWMTLPWAAVSPLPQDAQGPGILSTVETVHASVDRASTAALLQGRGRGLPPVHDLVAASVQVAVAEWSGRPVQAMDVYSHNRDQAPGQLDLSRTIGYVQATYPVVRTVHGSGEGAVRRLLAEPPGPAPYSFDAIRFFDSGTPQDRSSLAALPPCPVRLNYRGQLDRLEQRAPGSPISLAEEPTGANRAQSQRERYQLMFEGDIIDGELLVGLKYSRDHYRRETAQSLADRIAELLTSLAQSAQAPVSAEAVLAAAQSVLARTDLGLTSDLLALGLDSLDAARLVSLLPRDAGISVGDVLAGRRPAEIVRLSRPSEAQGTPDLVVGAAALSPRQIDLWLDSQLRPGHSDANVLVAAFDFYGPIDASRLEAALTSVVNRQTALRTAIRADELGRPTARLLTTTAALRTHRSAAGPDLQGLAEAAATQVEVSDGPLTVAILIERPGGLSLVLAIDHTCVDAYSLDILAAEISDALSGRTAAPPVPYATHVASQRRRIDTLSRNGMLDDWIDRLRPCEDVAWPTPPVPQPRSARLAHLPLRLPEVVAHRMHTTAMRYQVTSYVVGLAALTLAIHEVTGTESFCLGSPFSGRADAAFETTIGYFVAVAALPVSSGFDPSTEALLHRTAKTVIDAMRRQDLPLSILLRQLQRPRGPRPPLVQVQLAWPNYPLPQWQIPDVTVAERHLITTAAQFELTVELYPWSGRGEWQGVVEFDPAAVSATDAAATSSAFIAALERLTHG